MHATVANDGGDAQRQSVRRGKEPWPSTQNLEQLRRVNVEPDNCVDPDTSRGRPLGISPPFPRHASAVPVPTTRSTRRRCHCKADPVRTVSTLPTRL